MGAITEALNLLPEDTHASHLASLAKGAAQKMTATSGRKCAELLAKQDPLGWYLKTLLGSLRWASTKCSLTWKVSATPRGRLLFRLVQSEPYTSGSGFGWWRTPTVGMINQARSCDPEYAAKLAAKGQTVTLAAQVGALHGGQKLNPDFPLWLMGYPTGWLDTAQPGTP
jgi:hypothetical protein